MLRFARRFRSIPLRRGLSLLLLLCIPPVSQLIAQVSGATLSGTVVDPSGAAIPMAEIVIRNVATGVTRTIATNADGYYTAPNLLPGDYELKFTAAGFSTETRTGITLTVGAQLELNLKAEVGKIEQTINVSTEALAMQLTSSNLGGIVGSTTVQELPLNGRSWTDLTNLQPGVAQATTQNPAGSQGTGRGNRGFGLQMSISGARAQANNFRWDGVSLNDYANGGPSNVLGGSLGVDAIREFSVLTTNASAEYGRTSGAVVNAISRSGSNGFHGDVYEFLRNNFFDARNYFNSGPNPPFRRNQFGGAAGGPIIKDRTFFFADYEAIRQVKGITEVDTVPSVAARAGNLATGPVTVDPVVQKFLGIYPLPNGPNVGNGDFATFTFAGNQTVTENFVTTRMDHKIGSKDSIFGTYLFDQSPFTSVNALKAVVNGARTKRQSVILEESHIFTPAFLNTVRLGYNRNLIDNGKAVQALNPLADDLSLGAVPGKRAPRVNVSGLTTFNGGLDSITEFDYRWNSYQVYDDAFVTRGLHSIKFGIAAEQDRLNELTLSSVPGIFTFATLSDFLTNKPKQFSAVLASTPVTPRNLRQTIFGAYVQDDWRWRPNLTLNLGLRYEMSTVPTEPDGKLSTLLTITDVTPHTGDPYFHNYTKRNFEPRVGFAWDPFRDGKTAVRGGFGLYDVLPLSYFYLTLVGRAAPFYAIGSNTNAAQLAGTFVNGAFGLLNPSAVEKEFLEQNPKRSYVMQYNFTIQQQILPSTTVTAAYVGSRGVHQVFVTNDADQVIPTLTSAGYLWPIGGTKINPSAGSIRYLNWGGDTHYDALQMSVTKSMSHGFLFQGSFAWSKSIDDNSGAISSNPYTNSISTENWFDMSLNRAISDFNVGRLLTLSATWQVPPLKSAPSALGWISNGWEMSGIFRAMDGVPFTPTISALTDVLGQKNVEPYDYPNRLFGSGCDSAVNPGYVQHYIKTECFALPTAPSSFTAQCTAFSTPAPATPPSGTVYCANLLGQASRNSLIGPGVTNIDFSMVKNTRFSEQVNLQFRAEAFNLFNHPNFGPPLLGNNTDIFNSKGALNGVAGLLTSTTTDSRELQFALKFIW